MRISCNHTICLEQSQSLGLNMSWLPASPHRRLLREKLGDLCLRLGLEPKTPRQVILLDRNLGPRPSLFRCNLSDCKATRKLLDKNRNRTWTQPTTGLSLSYWLTKHQSCFLTNPLGLFMMLPTASRAICIK